jgi:O-antigen/teichoic acid export membrane protein
MAINPRNYLRRARNAALLLGPGLLDASFSALAGFAASLYAANQFDSHDLGAYALYFAAFMFASPVAQQLFYTPLAVAALASEPEARMRLILPNLPTGFLISGLSGLGAALAGILIAGQVDTATVTALAVTVALLVLISPIQDHVRSMFHLARRPWRAAAMSMVQLALICLAIGAMYLSNVPDAWVPFGSLVLANTGSTIFGLFLISESDEPLRPIPPLRELFRSGIILLPSGMINQGGAFAGAAILASVASASELGFAEAARVVSRPVFVLGFGISRALTPRLLEAGRDGSRDRARRIAIQYLAVLFLAGAIQLAVSGWPHPLNPFEAMIPRAYELKGLTVLTIVAVTVASLASLPRSLLVGAGRNRDILLISIAGTVARIVTIAALAPSLGAYAISAGVLAEIATEAAIGWKLVNRILR